jgi:hypothetical protein
MAKKQWASVDKKVGDPKQWNKPSENENSNPQSKKKINDKLNPLLK